MAANDDWRLPLAAYRRSGEAYISERYGTLPFALRQPAKATVALTTREQTFDSDTLSFEAVRGVIDAFLADAIALGRPISSPQVGLFHVRHSVMVRVSAYVGPNPNPQPQ